MAEPRDKRRRVGRTSQAAGGRLGNPGAGEGCGSRQQRRRGRARVPRLSAEGPPGPCAMPARTRAVPPPNTHGARAGRGTAWRARAVASSKQARTGAGPCCLLLCIQHQRDAWVPRGRLSRCSNLTRPGVSSERRGNCLGILGSVCHLSFLPGQTASLPFQPETPPGQRPVHRAQPRAAPGDKRVPRP